MTTSEPGAITVAELVRNGTLDAGMAALLWAAVDERVSFLTVAVPRFAGKSTLSGAVLALRPPGVELHQVAGEPEVLEQLRRERLGGYIVVGEFSQAPVPGYIWGEPVRRVFDTLSAGYSLQTSLHAPDVEQGMRAVTEGNGVPDEQASVFGLVLYIERLGEERSGFTRRLAEVYEVDAVRSGRPMGRTLYRWLPDGDRFVKENESQRFAHAVDDLGERERVMARLAASGRTSGREVAAAVASFRARHAVTE